MGNKLNDHNLLLAAEINQYVTENCLPLWRNECSLHSLQKLPLFATLNHY